MVEYAGYIPIEPIDWAAKAAGISNKFLDTYYDREKQRKDLDVLQDEAISEADKFETSTSQTFNNFILNGSQSAKSYIQAQNDLLKKGVIDTNTYKRNIQNSREGFSNLKLLTEGVNERIKVGTERINNGKASPMEQFIQDNIFNILDVSNKRFIQDQNGNGYVMSTDGKTKLSTKSLNNSLNQFIDTPDIIADVNKAVEGLGVGAMDANGKYTISQKLVGDWESKTKPQMAKNILASPQKAANLLAIEKGYTFTTDPKEAGDGNKILLAIDPNGAYIPKLTDAQNKEAMAAVEATIESRVDVKKKEEDKNETLKLQNQRQQLLNDRAELDFKYAKMNNEEKEKNKPLYYRMATINDVLSGTGTGMASIVGKQLSYANARGTDGAKKGEVAKLYSGYVVQDVVPMDNGKYKVIMKFGEGDTAKKAELIYDKEGLASDLNETLNAIPGAPKVNKEEVLQLRKFGSGSSPVAGSTVSTISGGKVR